MPSTPTVVYDVFANDGAGGPVDYTTAIATTASLTYTPTALALNSDTTFAVRARDSANSVGEKNVDAIVRIIVGGTGADVSARPNPPIGLSASPTSGGGLAVRWAYVPAGQAAAPTQFRVYLTAVSAGSMSYSSAAATVSYVAGRRFYTATLTGLSDATDYWVGVRSASGSIVEPNTTIITVTGSATAPSDIDGLAQSVEN
jgi:hypothetical protein